MEMCTWLSKHTCRHHRRLMILKLGFFNKRTIPPLPWHERLGTADRVETVGNLALNNAEMTTCSYADETTIKQIGFATSRQSFVRFEK